MREKFTIVVADDDADDQELMRKGLESCKVKVDIVPVFNGLHLMDYLLKRHNYKGVTGKPDLILVDLNMPLMDGFTVIREIMSNSSLREIPIYVITTSRSAVDRERAMELGATGFYSKGSSPKDIVRIMHEVCEECF
jgi:chemotaxis family two-component system response regulator Rcp1